MLFTTASMAVLGLASYASAHMTMNTPKPYGNPDNSPLIADGSNFPCKNLAPDFSSATSLALGSTQPLLFTGGATHGGGSCQISITYDNPPTKNSVFRVISSIEGGCPTKSNPGNIGNDASAPDPDTYTFTMPSNIPTGKAILAWTWFNKVGNREMYMNCAAVDITGGSSKRSEEDELVARNATMLMERDQTAFNSLPEMFKANIKNIGADSCTTIEGVDTLFPNPGSTIFKPGTDTNYGQPGGSGCGAAAAAVASAPASAPASSAAAAAPDSSSTGAAAPGVFATIPVSSAPAATGAPATTSAPAAASPPAASVTADPPAGTAPTASVAPSSTPAASSGGAGAQTPGSACSPEGEWNCIGGTSFQRCASGQWSAVQQMAAGTTCTAGESNTFDVNAVAGRKRSVRFSSEHIRRHLHAIS